VDVVVRQPFYTPTLLGTGLFLGVEELPSTEKVQVSLKLTLMYTGVHGLVFTVLGVIAAYFLLLAEKKPNLRIGFLSLFVILETGFVGAAFVFAGPVLHELAWPTVLVGSLLAAAGMVGYLWFRYSNRVIRP
jgi:hypothetical protein